MKKPIVQYLSLVLIIVNIISNIFLCYYTYIVSSKVTENKYEIIKSKESIDSIETVLNERKRLFSEIDSKLQVIDFKIKKLESDLLASSSNK